MEQNQNEQLELPKVDYEVTEHGHARWRGEDGRFVSKQTVADIFRVAYTENPSCAMPVEEATIIVAPTPEAPVVEAGAEATPRRFNGSRKLWQELKPIVNTPPKAITSELEPAPAKRERFRRPKKLVAVALGSVAMLGLGAHSSGEETERPVSQTKIERTIQPTLLANTQNKITVPSQIGKLPTQETKTDPYATPNNLGYDFFCLLPETNQDQQQSAKRKGMNKNMEAPVVRINDDMYPWDVLVEAGMNEAQIMPSLDRAAKQYKIQGGGYAWHGSGTSQWIEVHEKNRSYSDTRNIMRILGPYLQALTQKTQDSKAM